MNEPVDEVAATDGATLTVSHHGGQLLAWTPAGASAGASAGRLWLSPLAVDGPGRAIRGGIPVIFPQFADRGPLPKHGLARDRRWQVSTEAGAAATVRATLRDDDATRARWPHRFTLTLTATAAGDTLTLELAARNDNPVDDDPVDDDPVGAFTFTAALHTYLAVGDARAARVAGLEGLTATANADGAAVPLPPEPFPAIGPRDVSLPLPAAVRVRLLDPAGDRPPLVLHQPDGPHGRFDHLVVWNPGPQHGLPDVPNDGPADGSPGGVTGFVCLEAAALTPVTLAPGQVWAATTVLTG